MPHPRRTIPLPTHCAHCGQGRKVFAPTKPNGAPIPSNTSHTFIVLPHQRLCPSCAAEIPRSPDGPCVQCGGALITAMEYLMPPPLEFVTALAAAPPPPVVAAPTASASTTTVATALVPSVLPSPLSLLEAFAAPSPPSDTATAALLFLQLLSSPLPSSLSPAATTSPSPSPLPETVEEDGRRRSSRDRHPPELYVPTAFPTKAALPADPRFPVLYLGDGACDNGVHTFAFIGVYPLSPTHIAKMGGRQGVDKGLFAEAFIGVGSHLRVDGPLVPLTEKQLAKRSSEENEYLFEREKYVYVDQRNVNINQLRDEVIPTRYINHATSTDDVNMQLDREGETLILIVTKNVEAGTQFLFSYHGGRSTLSYTFAKLAHFKGGSSPHMNDCAPNSACPNRHHKDVIATGCVLDVCDTATPCKRARTAEPNKRRRTAKSNKRTRAV